MRSAGNSHLPAQRSIGGLPIGANRNSPSEGTDAVLASTLVTNSALARILLSAALCVIAVGCDGRGTTSATGSKPEVTEKGPPTSGDPNQPGPGPTGDPAASPIAPVPVVPDSSPSPGPSGPGIAPSAGKAPDSPGPNPNPPPVPEPLELLIVGAGLAGLAMLRRRRSSHSG